MKQVKIKNLTAVADLRKYNFLYSITNNYLIRERFFLQLVFLSVIVLNFVTTPTFSLDVFLIS